MFNFISVLVLNEQSGGLKIRQISNPFLCYTTPLVLTLKTYAAWADSLLVPNSVLYVEICQKNILF